MKTDRILAHQLSRPISNEEIAQVYGGTSYISSSPSGGVTWSPGGGGDQKMDQGQDDDDLQK